MADDEYYPDPYTETLKETAFSNPAMPAESLKKAFQKRYAGENIKIQKAAIKNPNADANLAEFAIDRCSNKVKLNILTLLPLSLDKLKEYTNLKFSPRLRMAAARNPNADEDLLLTFLEDPYADGDQYPVRYSAVRNKNATINSNKGSKRPLPYS